MSVAKCLGVDDLDAQDMQEVRAEWPGWQEVEQALNVVDVLVALPRWMKQATPIERDAVLKGFVVWPGEIRAPPSHSPGCSYLAHRWLPVDCAGSAT